MADKLPENFAEDWGALKSDIGHIKNQVDKTCDDFDELPCKQTKDNPITEIEKLKRDIGFFKWLGGIMLTAVTAVGVWIVRKVMNGG